MDQISNRQYWERYFSGADPLPDGELWDEAYWKRQELTDRANQAAAWAYLLFMITMLLAAYKNISPATEALYTDGPAIEAVPDGRSPSADKEQELLERETYNQKLEFAESKLRDAGQFVIRLFNDGVTYVLCEETKEYTVREGDAPERIAGNEHVHFQHGDIRRSVGHYTMLIAIEDANPDTTYPVQNGPLMPGDKLTLPQNGTCQPLESRGSIFIEADVPIPMKRLDG